MDDISSFGVWLRRRRKALDLTQDALAQLVGCSVVSIRKFEGDEQRPSRPMAERLAAQLQLPPDEHPAFVRFARGQLDAVSPALPTPATTIPTRPAETAVPTPHLGTLPTRLSSFIGRDTERRELRTLLEQPAVRLVTLTGTGGTGKTRLALQVATALATDYRDGVWFVDLAPLSDPDLVAATIAQALAVREGGGQPLIERLRAYLRDKRLLMVLDNFEQVVAAAPLVSALLVAAPQLTVLATSREPLHLVGEHEYAVPPLRVPDPRDRVPLEQLLAYDAVQLFVARAQAVKADFVVTPDDAPAIVALCRQLDGLPLAIELAAARVKLFSPKALLAHLDQRLTLLTGGARDLPARQQTMRATVEWSYQLLEADEQTLFRRLGVFVGGWTLAAAKMVCASDDEASRDVLDGLAALVDKSLIGQRPSVNGEPRFTMLETIRAYAREQLAVSGEVETLQQRHATYFLTQVETAEPQLDGPDQTLWLQQLEQEYDNLHAVLGWSVSVPDDQAIGLRMVASLHHFWGMSNHFHEGITWTERLLQASQTAHPALRAKALLRIGEIADWSNDLVIQATGWLEQAVALYRSIEDPTGMAEALMQLGRCKYWQAAYTEAQPLLEESLALFQVHGNILQILWAYLSLGDCAFYSVQMPRARHYFQEALRLSEQQQGPFSRAWALTCLGRVAHALGDTRQAQIYYTESLALFRSIGQRHQAPVLLELGRVAETEGRISAAFAAYTESLMLSYGITSRMRIPECLEGIASLLAASQPARTARLLGAAAALRAAVGVSLSPVYHAAYERTLITARTLLDEASFDVAYAAGQALTLDEAVAEALEVATPGASAAR